MPRLIPPETGNGHRPSSPDFRSDAGLPPDKQGLVPVLDVSDDTHQLLGREHDRALDPDDDDAGLLVGATVIFGNPSPVDSPDAGYATVTVGASTLWQAATEVVICVSQLGRDMPDWVASTDKHLAAVVAEHFTVKGYSTCKVIKLTEVPA